ncbi:hypothetical protein BDD12DRAFT_560189 [Trichophaea hybrida]|nr:hypothetical protein BDD12DRAFT_560189 [Trichophaea hybrida]
MERRIRVWSGGLSTISLTRDNMAGAEHTVSEEQELSTASSNRNDGAEDTGLEQRIEHRLIKPGRHDRSAVYSFGGAGIEHRLIKPGRWSGGYRFGAEDDHRLGTRWRDWRRLSTVPLNRDDMAGAERTDSEEQGVSTVSLNRDDMERRCGGL